MHDSPRITEMRVIPVTGLDSMLLNLSGAHAPWFTCNVVLLTDSAGHTGVGEVPGGESIREVLEQAKPLVLHAPLGDLHRVMNAIESQFGDRDAGGRGLQTFDQRITIHAVAAVEVAMLDTRCSPARRLRRSEYSFPEPRRRSSGHGSQSDHLLQ